MKLPNWFRIVWWIVLVLGVGYLCSKRFGAISNGAETSVDAFIFLVWVALLLLPLFSEFQFFGLKLKAQFDELKSHLTQQVSSLRTELHSTINSQISPHFYLAPPSDAQLPQIEEQIRKSLEQVIQTYGIRTAADTSVVPNPPQGVNNLFAVRYNIERELQRIYERLDSAQPSTKQPIYRIVNVLTEAGFLSPALQHAVREVYSICNPAIHGEDVSEAKLKFVEDVAPKLIAGLKAIK